MKPRRPSPSLVISIVSLVMATTGSAVAAVSFARNAGAVDGKSAVSAGATLAQAAGRLVATERTGPNRGRIPFKYLAGALRGSSTSFGRAIEVVDNATGAAVPFAAVPSLGTLSATCADQSRTAGIEDPTTEVSFTNQSGGPVNLARSTGNGAPNVAALLNDTQERFTITGSNTFRIHVERAGVNTLIEGVVRQDGAKTAAASCLVYGVAIQFG